jgi:drug/metabolite transporter (DMT)-like permease
LTPNAQSSDAQPAEYPPLASERGEPEERPLAAIGFVLMSMVVFSAMDTLSKLLVVDYSPIEIAWGRYAVNFLMLAPFVIRSRFRVLATARPVVQSLRGVAMLSSAILFMAGLAHMPIADATTIGFVSPLLVTALSIPFLGERVGVRRWAAVVLGFVGVLIIIRPGTAAFDPAALFPLLSASCWAGGLILTRRIKASEPALTTLSYTTLVGVLVLSAALPVVWRPLTLEAALLLGLMGALSTFGQYCLILGFMRGPASLLAPFSYSQMIWSTLAGVVIFDTVPGLCTWVGSAIVVASGLYVLHRERVVRGGAR